MCVRDLPIERGARLGQCRHRARLQNEDLPIGHRPFDVHRLAIKLLDLHAEAYQF
jgi:hypothetical protein